MHFLHCLFYYVMFSLFFYLFYLFFSLIEVMFRKWIVFDRHRVPIYISLGLVLTRIFPIMQIRIC